MILQFKINLEQNFKIALVQSTTFLKNLISPENQPDLSDKYRFSKGGQRKEIGT